MGRRIDPSWWTHFLIHQDTKQRTLSDCTESGWSVHLKEPIRRLAPLSPGVRSWCDGSSDRSFMVYPFPYSPEHKAKNPIWLYGIWMKCPLEGTDPTSSAAIALCYLPPALSQQAIHCRTTPVQICQHLESTRIFQESKKHSVRFQGQFNSFRDG